MRVCIFFGVGTTGAAIPGLESEAPIASVNFVI